MEKGRANLSRLPEAPIAKVIKDILGLWEVDCGIAASHRTCVSAIIESDRMAPARDGTWAPDWS